MWTDDDVVRPVWQRWHARVMAISLDALLRWALVVTSVTLSISAVLGILTWLWSVGAQAVALLARWL